MKKKHILLKLATSYPLPSKSLNPRGFHFDNNVGVWVSNNDNKPLIFSEKTPPSTKKMDIETGEDQKGT